MTYVVEWAKSKMSSLNCQPGTDMGKKQCPKARVGPETLQILHKGVGSFLGGPLGARPEVGYISSPTAGG